MPPRRKSIPSYLLHRPTGEARISVYGPDGKRRSISLGKFDSPESKARYREILKSLEPAPDKVPAVIPSFKPIKNPTVAAVCLAFLDHATTYYAPGATETYFFRVVAEILLADDDAAAISEMLASDFGLGELAVVRDRMIAKKWARPTINNHVRRVRTLFRWAGERGMVSPTKWGELQTLSSLKRGRMKLAEYRDVPPVDDAEVEKVLPHLTPTLARMVRFHRLTGCRPQDVCNLNWGEIDRTGAVWLFKPAAHKNAHRGHTRIITIGPRAQQLLGVVGTGIVFSPSASSKEFQSTRSAHVPMTPVRVRLREKRLKLHPQKFRPRYSTSAYGKSIHRACLRAGVAPWAPNQLRHAALTEIRDKFGADVAQAIGGHKNVNTTQIYAKPSAEAARASMEAVG